MQNKTRKSQVFCLGTWRSWFSTRLFCSKRSNNLLKSPQVLLFNSKNWDRLSYLSKTPTYSHLTFVWVGENIQEQPLRMRFWSANVQEQIRNRNWKRNLLRRLSSFSQHKSKSCHLFGTGLNAHTLHLIRGVYSSCFQCKWKHVHDVLTEGVLTARSPCQNEGLCTIHFEAEKGFVLADPENSHVNCHSALRGKA